MRYDNVFGVMDELFPAEEKETKKEGPQEGPKQKSQLHYTQAEGIRQVPRGLYLVGRTTPTPATGLGGRTSC